MNGFVCRSPQITQLPTTRAVWNTNVDGKISTKKISAPVKNKQLQTFRLKFPYNFNKCRTKNHHYRKYYFTNIKPAVQKQTQCWRKMKEIVEEIIPEIYMLMAINFEWIHIYTEVRYIYKEEEYIVR